MKITVKNDNETTFELTSADDVKLYTLMHGRKPAVDITAATATVAPTKVGPAKPAVTQPATRPPVSARPVRRHKKRATNKTERYVNPADHQRQMKALQVLLSAGQDGVTVKNWAKLMGFDSHFPLVGVMIAARNRGLVRCVKVVEDPARSSQKTTVVFPTMKLEKVVAREGNGVGMTVDAPNPETVS